jgi:hypothetical protein
MKPGSNNFHSGARHACDQGDGLDSYTWTQYDSKLGGSQRIVDGQVNFEIWTEYVKVPGGGNGGSWAARIRGVPVNPGSYMFISYGGYNNSLPTLRFTCPHLPHILCRIGGSRWN